MNSNQLKSFIRRHGPDILSGLATVGVGVTAWLSGRAAVKISDNERHNLPANKKDRFKQTWKYYIPPVLSGLLTVAGIWGSRKMSAGQLSSMVAATGYLVASRNKIAKKIEDANSRFANLERPVSVEETGKGDILCLEAFSGRWFRSSEEAVNDAIRDLDTVYHHDFEQHGFAYAGLNDLYSLLGIQTTYFGEQVGWCNEINGDHIYYVSHYLEFEGVGMVLVIEPSDQTMPEMCYMEY